MQQDVHTAAWLDFDRTITVVVFLVVLASACLMPIQSDTWWHLRAGHDMWRSHAILLRDTFSYTARGDYWPNHEWLSEILFFATYRAAGLPGLTALAAVAVTAAIALSWALMRGPVLARVLLLAIAVPSIVPVWTVRPHVFTLVLFLAAFHLILRARFWPVPILFALWANLHGGVAIGFVVLGGAAAADVWVNGWSRLGRWMLLIPACLAATLVTPLGIHLWTAIEASVRKSAAIGVSEYAAASFGWSDGAFWVLASALVLLAVARRQSIRTEAALVFVSFALLPFAVRYARNIPLFLLVAVPTVSRLLPPRLLQRRGSRRDRPTVNASLLATVATACVALVAVSWSAPVARLQWRPVSDTIAGAIDTCPGPLYNRFDDGGYVIWFAPAVPVFVDNRQDPYPLDFLQAHLHAERSGRYEQVFRQYGIRCAFLPPTSPTAERLVAAGWRVRASDARWEVLERSTDDIDATAAASEAKDR